MSTKPLSDTVSKAKEFEQLKRRIHQKLVDKLDMSRITNSQSESFRKELRLIIEKIYDNEDMMLNRSERERLVDEVMDETLR